MELENVSMPNFVLTESEQKQLVSRVIKCREEYKSHYYELYESFKSVRKAIHCVNNFERMQSLMPKEALGNQEPIERIGVNIPVLKSVLNNIVGRIEASIFSGDSELINWIPSDPNDYELFRRATIAFEKYREDIGCRTFDKSFIKMLCAYGNAPVGINTQSEKNCINNIIDVYELIIPPEHMELFQGVFDIYSTRIHFYEEEVVSLGEVFKVMTIEDADNGQQIGTWPEDPDQKQGPLQHFVDEIKKVTNNTFDILASSKIVDKRINQIEYISKGSPVPIIYPILNTYITRDQATSRNQESFNWVYVDYKRTLDVYNDDDIYDKTRSELLKDNKFIGSTEISDSDYAYYIPSKTKNNIQTNEPVIKYTTAYFDVFTFDNDSSNNGKPKTLRNFLVCIADDKFVAKCYPNLNKSKYGTKRVTKNPLIWATFEPEPNENVGTSPLVDANDLSKVINILTNFAFDCFEKESGCLAAFGDLGEPGKSAWQTVPGRTDFIYSPSSQQAQNMGITSIRDAITRINIGSETPRQALSLASELRGQIQSISHADLPYYEQNSPTATQVLAMQEQTNSIKDSTINHIAFNLTQIYKRVFELCIQNDIVVENVEIYDKETGATSIEDFNFGLLKDKTFSPKILTRSPTFTKAYQANKLQEILVQVIQSQDKELESLINKPEMFIKMLKLNNIYDESLHRSKQEAQQKMIESDQKEQIWQQYQQAMAIQQQQLEEEQNQNIGDMS